MIDEVAQGVGELFETGVPFRGVPFGDDVGGMREHGRVEFRDTLFDGGQQAARDDDIVECAEDILDFGQSVPIGASRLAWKQAAEKIDRVAQLLGADAKLVKSLRVKPARPPPVLAESAVEFTDASLGKINGFHGG